MTDRTTMPKVSRLEVVEVGARRRWTLEEKLRIIAESSSGPRMVSSTARRHGLSANQLFVWRRLVRGGLLRLDAGGVGFAPAVIAREMIGAPARDRQAPPGRIEIVLSVPKRVIVDADLDPAAIVRVLAMLEW